MIYLIPTGGLCNRLRTIASAISLANELGQQLKIFWVKDDGLNCQFQDLFEPIKIENVQLKERNRKPVLHRVYRSNRPFLKVVCYFIDVLKKVYFDAELHNKEPIEAFKKKDFHAGKFKRIVIETQHRFYPYDGLKKYFCPVMLLQKRIESQVSRFGKFPVGVHLRRTDLPQQNMSPTSVFVSEMENIILKNNGVKFYVASDSREDKELLKRKFNERILTSFEDVSRNSRSGMQDAVVDLFCLSRCNMVLGTYYSSFSSVAACDLGGIPLKIMKKMKHLADKE